MAKRIFTLSSSNDLDPSSGLLPLSDNFSYIREKYFASIALDHLAATIFGAQLHAHCPGPNLPFRFLRSDVPASMAVAGHSSRSRYVVVNQVYGKASFHIRRADKSFTSNLDPWQLMKFNK